MAIAKSSWALLLLVATIDSVSAQCDETRRTPAGLIQSPGYPVYYPSRVDYTWCVNVEGATGIDITFVGEFALELNEDNDGTESCKDSLEIGQGNVPFQNSIGVFCGNITPPAQRVDTRQMWVNMYSDRNVGMSGFQLEYRADLDVCYSSPCTNGGTCMSDLTNYTYTCHCPPAWQGGRCEIDVDECASDPCENSGICTHQVGVHLYRCFCAPGFNGNNCEIDIDDCVNVTCEHQGSCVDLVNDFSCQCSSGWEGQLCENDVDECASDPCQNNGECFQVGVDFYNCSCAPGFTGANCEIDIDDCEYVTCEHQGRCLDLVNDFVCICSAGWEGRYCQNDTRASETLNGGGNPTTTIIVVVVVCVVVLIVVIVAAVFVIRRAVASKERQNNAPEDVVLEQIPGSPEDGYQSLRLPRGRLSTHTYQGLAVAQGENKNQPTTDSVYEDVKTSLEFPRSKLTMKEKLGQGRFGEVFRAEALNMSGHPGITIVAVKTLKSATSPSASLPAFFKELDVLEMLGSHPNVVSFLGCCTEEEPFYLLLEYVSGGSLQSTLRASRTQQTYNNLHGGSKSLSSRVLTKFAWDVAKGMNFLSSRKIIHRDLATRNVLVAADRTCKVSDFGISREGEVYERRANARLPIRWMAPESLFHSLCTVQSDVWSFGVLLWEIVTLGATPYSGMTPRQVMGYVKHGYRMEKPPHCDDKIYKIMAACWEEQPTERPSFQELERAMKTLIEEEYINLASFNEAIYANPQTSTEEKC